MIVLFDQEFIQIMINVALVMISGSVITLITLFIKDVKNKKLW